VSGLSSPADIDRRYARMRKFGLPTTLRCAFGRLFSGAVSLGLD
jgi:hypothetical protein